MIGSLLFKPSSSNSCITAQTKFQGTLIPCSIRSFWFIALYPNLSLSPFNFFFTASFTSSIDVSFLMYLILNGLRRVQNLSMLHFPYCRKSLASKSKIFSRLKFLLTQLSRKLFSFHHFSNRYYFQSVCFKLGL